MSLILRDDLEPWDCGDCAALVRKGQFLNHKFYCYQCAPAIALGLAMAEVEKEDEAEKIPEVNLENAV